MRKAMAIVLIPLLVAVGCTADALRGTAPRETTPQTSMAPLPAVEVAVPQPPTEGFGNVQIGVRWPSYQAQAIPYSAVALDIAILNAGDTPVATASIVRPAASVTLSRVPVGTYTVRLTARQGDAAKTVVAEATSPIDVIANRIAAANIPLIPTYAPRLDYIHPTSGPPGTQITLYGANLAPLQSNGTYSVLVDDRPMQASMVQTFGKTQVYLMDLPSWAGDTATLSISVDGLRIPASQERVFTRQVIRKIAISPETVEHLATHQPQPFTATAYRDTDGTVQVPGVTFNWSLADQYPPTSGPMDVSPFTLSGGLFKATATGSVTVRVEAGGCYATASVVIDTIGTEPTPGPGGGAGGGAP